MSLSWSQASRQTMLFYFHLSIDDPSTLSIDIQFKLETLLNCTWFSLITTWGFRAKLSAFRINIEKEREEKCSKEVRCSALRKIFLVNYKDCLMQQKTLIKHKMFVVKQKILTLSWDDYNRVLWSNSTNTVPHGYCKYIHIYTHFIKHSVFYSLQLIFISPTTVYEKYCSHSCPDSPKNNYHH